MKGIKIKLFRCLWVTILLVSCAFFSVIFTLNYAFENADAADDAEVVDVNLEIGGSITNSCTDSITMGGITGTGQSALATNEITCTVITSNSTGYNLTFSSATAYLEDADGNQIGAYTPGQAGTPEAWSVASSASEWGARLKKSGTTTYDSKWGDAAGSETYASADVKWHNVTNSGSFTVVSRGTETAGDTEIIQVGAEVGSSKFQPTGTYDVDMTVTATTN